MSLDVPVGPNGQALPIVRLSTIAQQVAYNASGGASTASAAFNAATEAIMISVTSADADLRIAFGLTPVASGTTHLILKSGVYYFRVLAGQKVAFLSNSATTGTVTFSELQSLG